MTEFEKKVIEKLGNIDFTLGFCFIIMALFFIAYILK